MRAFVLVAGTLLVLPFSALAEGQGPTQSRDGLDTATASGGKTTNNSLPAGSVNAQTGPQSRPAYPSGSTTANPGAAFVAAQPKPATGALARPTGVTTKTITGARSVSQPNAAGVGQATRAPQ